MLLNKSTKMPLQLGDSSNRNAWHILERRAKWKRAWGESYSSIRIDTETKQFKRTACTVIELLVVFWLLCHLYEIKYLCTSAMHTQTQTQTWHNTKTHRQRRFITKLGDWDTDTQWKT